MLPTPDSSVWSSSARLTAELRRRSRGDEQRVVEVRVERVAGDVGDRRPARAAPAGRGSGTSASSCTPPKVRWSTKRSSRPPSVKPIRTCRCFSSGASGRLHEQLAGHAQVRDQRTRRLSPRRQRQPEVLAAPRDGVDRARRPAGRRGPARRRGGGAPRGRGSTVDRGDRAAGDPARQAVADGLDLGKLRHRSAGRVGGRRGRRRPSPALGARPARARRSRRRPARPPSCCARCSARSVSPATVAAAVKVFWWSGPLEVIV